MEQAWNEKLARAAVSALFGASIVSEEDFERAIQLVAVELRARIAHSNMLQEPSFS